MRVLMAAAARGWRTFRPDLERAERPMLEMRIANRVASIRAGSTSEGSGAGKSAKWTLSGASGSTAQTRFW